MGGLPARDCGLLWVHTSAGSAAPRIPIVNIARPSFSLLLLLFVFVPYCSKRKSESAVRLVPNFFFSYHLIRLLFFDKIYL